MRLLANRWSSLTHASHCMTTSSHTDESKSKPSHVLQGILTPDASLFLGLGTGSKYAGLHTPRLSKIPWGYNWWFANVYSKDMLLFSRIYVSLFSELFQHVCVVNCKPDDMFLLIINICLLNQQWILLMGSKQIHVHVFISTRHHIRSGVPATGGINFSTTNRCILAWELSIVHKAADHCLTVQHLACKIPFIKIIPLS